MIMSQMIRIFLILICCAWLVQTGFLEKDHVPENYVKLRSGVLYHDHDSPYALKSFMQTRSKSRQSFIRRSLDNPDGQWIVSLNVLPSEKTTQFVCKNYPCYYIHQGHYLVQAPLSYVRALEKDKRIKWIGVYNASLKIDPKVKSEMQGILQKANAPLAENFSEKASTKTELVIWLPDISSNHRHNKQRIDQIQSEWNRQWERHNVELHVSDMNFAHAKVPKSLVPDFVDSIASKPETLWIEHRQHFRTKNRFASSILQGGFSFDNLPAYNRGLDGTGQVIGIGDTGLQWNHTFFQYFNSNVTNNTLLDSPELRNNITPPRFINVDISTSKDFENATVPGKITAYLFYNTTDTIDSMLGHGTAAAGVVVGNVNLSNFAYPFFGIAPQAQIAFADFNSNETDLDFDIQPPVDILSMAFAPLASLGGVIQSFSWGSTDDGYFSISFLSDLYSFYAKEGLLLFAAGNEGTFECCNGTSINSPASAKNTLAVGSSVSAQFPSISILDASGSLIFANQIGEFFNDTRESSFSKPLNGTPITGPILTLDSWPCNGAPQNVSGKIVFLLASGGQSPSCTPLMASANLQQAGANGAVFLTNTSLVNVQLDENVDPDIIIPVIRLKEFHSDDIQEIGRQQPAPFVILSRNITDAIDSVSFFSSQGPTFDGRIKPDVVGPGEALISSHALGFANFRSGLITFGGTSFSAPAVAGIGLLIRQYFMEGYYPSGTKQSNDSFAPSGSLLKAMIVNSARRMTGVAYLNSTGSEEFKDLVKFNLSDEVYPYPFQGHGRVNSENVLFFNDSSFRLAVESERNITTGDIFSYTVELNASTLFSATMVYADPPGSVLSDSPTVNSLLLSLTLPNGTIVWGNQQRDGHDGSKFVRDVTNNVQKIILAVNESGTYRLNVTGHSIPIRHHRSFQSYALVATNFTSFCFPDDDLSDALCI
jgi:subtilisin family serine protease